LELCEDDRHAGGYESQARGGVVERALWVGR
jgi:hypothetical protein